LRTKLVDRERIEAILLSDGGEVRATDKPDHDLSGL
jgi:hypothetical protein